MMRYGLFASIAWMVSQPASALEVPADKQLTGSSITLSQPLGDKQAEALITNRFFEYVPYNYLFERNQTIALQSPLDGRGSLLTKVYKLIPPNKGETDFTKFSISKEPIFSFSGKETLVFNEAASDHSQKDDNLLIASKLSAGPSQEDKVFRLKNGEKLFERSIEMGETPASGFAVYIDNQSHWVLLGASIGKIQKSMNLTLTLANANTKNTVSYPIELPAELVKKCLAEPMDCGVVITPQSPYNKQSINYKNENAPSIFEIGLGKTPTKIDHKLLNFTISDTLQPTAR